MGQPGMAEREGIEMSRYEVRDISGLEHICRDMTGFMQPLEQVIQTALRAADQMGQTTERLADAALQAEQTSDYELLRFIVSDLLPQMDGIYQMYGQFLLKGEESRFTELKQSLQRTEKWLNTFKPNCLFHIAADNLANVGDYILVRSLRKLVEGKNPDISWYSADVRGEVNGEYLAACNRSQAVILGGGGLFLKDTNPNEISGWQWACPTEDLKKIKTPIYVMGVGYNRFRGQEDFAECFTESINQLVEQSAFFGLRNYGSIEAIRGYLRKELKDKVKYHPCATTVLSKLYQIPRRAVNEPYIAINCAFDRAELRYRDKMDDVMMSIARVMKELAKDYGIHCYIHCPADERICRYLDIAGVSYEKIMLGWEMGERQGEEMPPEEYLRYFTDPELVLAVRGHAQMIPFGCRTPAVSMISHDKLKWFLEDIGHPEWGIEVLDKDFEAKLLEKSRYMLSHREEICRQIEEAQERLWEILQENLKSLAI